MCFIYYKDANTIFLDGEPLIKGMPARLLHRILKAYVETGQEIFFLSELKTDGDTGLIPNLEARLERLARRLADRTNGVRLVRLRGCRRIQCDGLARIEER